jgi:hypothetical protein
MKRLSLACLFGLLTVLGGISANAQEMTLDSLVTGYDQKSLDSLARELSDFLDVFYKERSFFNFSLTAANGFYNFKTNNSIYLEAGTHLTLSPSIAYYNKSGFSFSASAYGLEKQRSTNFFQLAISPSYAYLKNRDFATGVAYTHYFTKDFLPFYTTPLNNEWYGWVTLKKWWLEPTLAFGYAMGTQTQIDQREKLILAQAAFPRHPLMMTESERDLALSLSLKHDFFVSHVISPNGFLMITPLLLVSSGTQNYGFNTSYTFNSEVLNSFLLGSENSSSSASSFGIRSWTFILSGDYSMSKFFIQPQVIMDYYLPDTEEKRFRCITALSAGVNF